MVTINRIFNKKLITTILIFLSLLFAPHFFVTRISISGSFLYCNSQLWTIGNFWNLYNSIILTWVSYWGPMIVLLASNILIVCFVLNASKERKKIMRSTNSARQMQEKRTTKTLLSISLLYLLVMLPNGLTSFVKLVTGASVYKLVFLFSLISVTKQILDHNSILVRCGDILIFWRMIPEYRMRIKNLFGCKP